MKLTFAFALLFTLVTGNIRADNQAPVAQNATSPSSPKESLNLPGSNNSIEECVWGNNLAFVGKITHLEKDLKIYNNCIHLTLQFDVSQNFQDSFDPKSTFTTQVIWIDGGFHEDLPKIGDSYLIFAFRRWNSPANSYLVEKIAPDTQANISKVQQLLANPPSSKQQANANAPTPQKLPGDNLTPEAALAQSDTVFVGTVLHLGPVVADAVEWYGLSKAKVSQVLFGTRSDVTGFYFAGEGQPPPTVGISYVFIGHTSLESGWGAVQVVKFMPVTDDNIAMVKKVIATSLDSKAKAPSILDAQNDSEKLPGSGLKIQDALDKADFIFVAAASTNVMYFVQTLRGASDNTTANSVYVNYKLDPANHEAAPKNGAQYIYFIRKPISNGSYNAIKILPGTADNIIKVKQLIWPTP